MDDYYAFDAAGLAKGNASQQLRAFHSALMDYGDEDPSIPGDWWEVFRRLKALMEHDCCPRSPEGKRIVFLDEFPWFDTQRSDFLDAFADFWNRWAQLRSALSLSTMATREFPWESETSKPGAQVDLVIERPGRLTYLCEMKCTNEPLVLSRALADELAHKRGVQARDRDQEQRAERAGFRCWSRAIRARGRRGTRRCCGR